MRPASNELVGLHDLAITVGQAVLHEYARGRDLYNDVDYNDVDADHTY